MIDTSVLNFPTDRARTGTLPSADMLAVMKVPSTSVEKTEQLFALCRNDYPWHCVQNQQEAHKYLQGAHIAYRHKLASQVQLYKEHLIRIVTKDMAERTCWLAKEGGNAVEFMYYHSDYQPMPTSSFRVPEPFDRGHTQRYEWFYIKLNAFGRIIPPHALAMFEQLENERIIPQAYWVADKIAIAQSRSVDPVLCAQFGRWFAGIAYWD